MLLSQAKRFLFIKGYKVAGTSVEVHLAPQLEDDAIVTPILPAGPASHRPRNFQIDKRAAFYNHIPATEIIRAIGRPAFENLTSWGLVRDPVQKILSYFYMYHYLKGGAYTLDDAIHDCTSEADRYCDSQGCLLVNDIFRYEDMESALPPFLSRFGLTADGLSDVREKSVYRRAYDGPPITPRADQMDRIRSKFAFEMRYYS